MSLFMRGKTAVLSHLLRASQSIGEGCHFRVHKLRGRDLVVPDAAEL